MSTAASATGLRANSAPTAAAEPAAKTAAEKPAAPSIEPAGVVVTATAAATPAVASLAAAAPLQPREPAAAALRVSEAGLPAQQSNASVPLTTAADEPPWLDEEPPLAEPDGSGAAVDQDAMAPWDDTPGAPAPMRAAPHAAAAVKSADPVATTASARAQHEPAQAGQPGQPGPPGQQAVPARPSLPRPGRPAMATPAREPAAAAPPAPATSGLALGAASASASPLPHEPNETTSRWLAWLEPVLAAGKLNGLVRELAVQAEAAECPGPELPAGQALTPCLIVARESLRQAALRERLQAALAEVHGRPVQIETRPGAVRDSATLRDNAAKARRQVEAETLVAGHPQVRALLQHFPGAFVVPGSIRPTN